MIIILVFSFFIVLFIPIGVRVIYDNTFSDIDVFLFKKIKYKFDLDEFVRLFITDKNKPDKISLKAIVNNLELIIKSKKIIKDFCKNSKVVKSTIILKQDYDNIYTFISFWSIVSRYSFILKKYFKKVNNEYYMISDANNDISIELIFKFKLYKVLFILIKNIKELLKILKSRRRQKNESSYL